MDVAGDWSQPDRELYRIMEFVRNMERRRLIKPQDILATLQSIPEDESESELQEHVFDSDSDEDFIPQNISSESEDSEGTNPEDIPSTSTGDRAHAVMLPRDHPPGRGQKKSAKRPRNERTTDNDGGEVGLLNATRETFMSLETSADKKSGLQEEQAT
ncbi:gap junction gamma-1 protein isoform X2 [Phyllobates terribilis]|uniref:gap junction gamma-1 protein isoform X2 n=1 Tax=Phyllobates terribilis TaxID=111132 RepID=UPI003CCB66E1